MRVSSVSPPTIPPHNTIKTHFDSLHDNIHKKNVLPSYQNSDHIIQLTMCWKTSLLPMVTNSFFYCSTTTKQCTLPPWELINARKSFSTSIGNQNLISPNVARLWQRWKVKHSSHRLVIQEASIHKLRTSGLVGLHPNAFHHSIPTLKHPFFYNEHSLKFYDPNKLY